MINLDISTLAILPSAQNDVAKFLANSMNIGKYNLPSRYILQHVPWDISNISNTFLSKYFYPDVPTPQNASRIAGDGHDPVFLGEVEFYIQTTTVIGDYQISVLAHSLTPGNPDLETTVFFSDPVTNPMVANQIQRVVLPLYPITELFVEAGTTGAGTRLDIVVRMAYNGIFFTGL